MTKAIARLALLVLADGLTHLGGWFLARADRLDPDYPLAQSVAKHPAGWGRPKAPVFSIDGYDRPEEA